MGSQTNEQSILYAPWLRVAVTGVALAFLLLISAGGAIEWSAALLAPDFWNSFWATIFSPAIYVVVVPIYAYRMAYRWHTRLDVLRRLAELCVIAMFASQVAVRADNPFGLNISSQWRMAWLIGLAGLLIVGVKLLWLIRAEKWKLAHNV